MNKLVIVEGPDASGKTTLAKKIACKLGFAYIHFSGAAPLHGAMEDYHLSILRSAEWNMRHNNMGFVFDRFWPSELVYVPVMRPHMDGVYRFDKVREVLDPLNPFYVFCMDDEVEERYKANIDPSHPYYPEQHRKIVAGYRGVMEVFDGPRVIHYDLNVPGRDDEVISIIDRYLD